MSTLTPPTVQVATPQRTALPWRWIGLGAAGVMAISALLPWLTVRAAFVGEISASGTEGDGKIVLGLAVVVAIAFALQKKILSIVMAAVSASFALFEVIYISSQIGDANAEMDGMGSASIGVGVWLLVLAAAAILTAAIKLPRKVQS